MVSVPFSLPFSPLPFICSPLPDSLGEVVPVFADGVLSMLEVVADVMLLLLFVLLPTTKLVPLKIRKLLQRVSFRLF